MATKPPFRAFYFDCDSTLSSIEGVDELARLIPQELRQEILDLTEGAMDGRLPLAEVYQQRLQRLAPSRQRCEDLGQLYIEHLVPEAADVVSALLALGKQVGVISGGLEIPVRILAAHLGIPPENVRAVPLVFDDDGGYRDFDRSSPLWQNRGKVEVISALPPEQRPVLYLGDGVTDLEVKGTADLFVGFGGVAVRKTVKRQAEAWVEGPGLAPLLGIGLDVEEKRRLQEDPRFAGLIH